MNLLEASNVSKTYGSGEAAVKALKKISFSVPKGEYVVIALLKEASRKYEQTIVMITHSRSIAQTADRALNVSDGVLTDLGRCSE